MSARYMNENGSMVPRDNGCWMLVTDHSAEVERLEAKAYAIKCDRDGCMAALENIAAERDAAVARGERAEAIIYDEAMDHRAHGFCDCPLCKFADALAAASDKPQSSSCDSCSHKDLRLDNECAAFHGKDDCPHYAALSPEPWGGPEGEE